MGGRFPRVMRGRRASLLARGRRVWVSHTCAAGDISRTFAPASWSPGASRACAAGDAWRAQRRARKRVFSAVCRSPAVRNSDLQRTALRGSKAASSGGRFFARAARGAVPMGTARKDLKIAESLRRPPVPVVSLCGVASLAAGRGANLARCVGAIRRVAAHGANKRKIAGTWIFPSRPAGTGQRSAECALCAAVCGGVSRWGSCCRSLRRERARRALGRPFWDGVERFENRGIAVEAARAGCRAVWRRCARRVCGAARAGFAALCDDAALAACEGEEQAVDCVCLLFPSRPFWDGVERFENRGIAVEAARTGCRAVRHRFARRRWGECVAGRRHGCGLPRCPACAGGRPRRGRHGRGENRLTDAFIRICRAVRCRFGRRGVWGSARGTWLAVRRRFARRRPLAVVLRATLVRRAA